MLFCNVFPAKRYYAENARRARNVELVEDDDTRERRIRQERLAFRDYLNDTCPSDAELSELKLVLRFIIEVVQWCYRNHNDLSSLEEGDGACHFDV
jgi:hypothetical protein